MITYMMYLNARWIIIARDRAQTFFLLVINLLMTHLRPPNIYKPYDIYWCTITV